MRNKLQNMAIRMQTIPKLSHFSNTAMKTHRSWWLTFGALALVSGHLPLKDRVECWRQTVNALRF